jgi:hypothetical protein
MAITGVGGRGKTCGAHHPPESIVDERSRSTLERRPN